MERRGGGAGEVFVGLDLGTSALKGVALDASGLELGHARSAYGTDRPVAGAAEQTPMDWVRALREVMGELVGICAPASIRALGLSGMLPTLVTLDRDGRPTGPAITWEDNRGERFAPARGDTPEAQRLYQATGQWVDGRYLLPMYCRLAIEEPARAAVTSTVCSAKDFLFSYLTDELVTDPSTATGSGCYVLDGSRYDDLAREGAATRIGRALPQLPPVIPSSSVRAMRPELRSELGLGDVAVCLGAADSVLGSVGVGAHDPGTAAYLSGTSTVVLAAVDGPTRDPSHRFLVTPTVDEGRFALEMDLLSTGSAVAWATELVGKELPDGEVVALGAAHDPRDVPVFLPYLAGGEQGALWESALAGTVLGLELQHGPSEVVRALLTGIVLESKRCMDVVRTVRGAPSEVLASGGLVEAPELRQDLADALGVPVRVPVRGAAGASARGAAIVAAASQGVDLTTAPAAGERSVPSAERTALWERLWVRHEEARLAVSSLYRSWATEAVEDAEAVDHGKSVEDAEAVDHGKSTTGTGTAVAADSFSEVRC